ncbi:hypothetical protein CHU98_g8537, partial [Xylaria longipes]
MVDKSGWLTCEIRIRRPLFARSHDDGRDLLVFLSTSGTPAAPEAEDGSGTEVAARQRAA